MRLTAHQQQVIKEAAQDAFGPDVRVHLFGSRVDDTPARRLAQALRECHQHAAAYPATSEEHASMRNRAVAAAARLEAILNNLVLQPGWGRHAPAHGAPP